MRRRLRRGEQPAAPTSPPATYGSTIRAARIAKGVSLRSFAESIGERPEDWCMVEHDEATITPELEARVCAAFDIPPWQLEALRTGTPPQDVARAEIRAPGRVVTRVEKALEQMARPVLEPAEPTPPKQPPRAKVSKLARRMLRQRKTRQQVEVTQTARPRWRPQR